MNSVAVSEAEELLSALRALAARLGRTPRLRDLQGKNPGTKAYFRVFGSWNAALLAAGFVVNKASPASLYRPEGDPREDALRALREAARLVGGAPSARLYTVLRRGAGRTWPSVPQVQRLFGSWSRALEAAGLYPEGEPDMETRLACALEAFSRAAARGFAVPSDFDDLNPEDARCVKERLQHVGVPVVRVGHEIGDLLVVAAGRGWPEVDGHARGRDLARRLSCGEPLQRMAASEEITVERVRQLVTAYLERAGDGCCAAE